MFTEALRAQNPALIQAARDLWQQGAILPDTYVIDVDQVLENGRQLLSRAAKHNITLYLMSKQFGRNPWLAQRLIRLGFRGMVAVDFKEARTLRRAGIPICHLGHLVQLPTSQIAETVAACPEIITLFSLEKAREISAAAQQCGVIQPIMLKIYDEGDCLYAGQEAGFALRELDDIARAIRSLPGITLAGLTHFPCLLWDETQQQTLPTHNLHTLLTARNRLRELGISITQLNAPSASSCSTLPVLAQHSVTHAEPGHALTGTLHSNQQGTQTERIAMLYLSEISHQFQGNSYCFGGGYYRRGQVQNALVYPSQDDAPVPTRLLPVNDSCIDYHLSLAGQLPPGSAVVMCFRTQIFVTRSDVALVSGIQTGKPVLEAVYDSLGNTVSGV